MGKLTMSGPARAYEQESVESEETAQLTVEERIVYVDKIVEIIKEVPFDRIVEVVKPFEVIKEVKVEVPVYHTVEVEKIVYVDKIVEKLVEVPVIRVETQVIEKIVETKSIPGYMFVVVGVELITIICLLINM